MTRDRLKLNKSVQLKALHAVGGLLKDACDSKCLRVGHTPDNATSYQDIYILEGYARVCIAEALLDYLTYVEAMDSKAIEGKDFFEITKCAIEEISEMYELHPVKGRKQ